MMDAEKLRQSGIDFDSGVRRFVGDRELYETVLKAFLNDTLLERASAAFDQNDRQALLSAVHELKGASGNSDMTELFSACCRLLVLLRSSDCSLEQIAVGFECLKRAYLLAQEGIRAALSV